jgi:hypothetical protein
MQSERSHPEHEPSDTKTPYEAAHRRRNPRGEEALQSVYSHAEKLGKLILAPQRHPEVCPWVPRGVDEQNFASFKVSEGARPRPRGTVVKFADEASMLKRCLLSLLHLSSAGRSLVSSRSFVAPSPNKIAKCSKNKRESRSVLRLLFQYFECPQHHESRVPVDSASLEQILLKACEQEDAASASLAPLEIIARSASDPCGDPEQSLSLQQSDSDTGTCSVQSLDLNLHNEVAQMVAFGCDLSLGNKEREEHFASDFLSRSCSLTRNMACIDLLELGARQSCWYEQGRASKTSSARTCKLN